MKKVNDESSTVIELCSKSNAITRKLDGNLGAIHGIGFIEYMVLHHLNESPQLLMRRIDLADSLGRSASGVTKMLNPLEKIGLVSKEVNPRDARVSLVKLTASGLKTYQQASNSLNQVAVGIFQRIKPAEIQRIQDLFNRLVV